MINYIVVVAHILTQLLILLIMLIDVQKLCIVNRVKHLNKLKIVNI